MASKRYILYVEVGDMPPSKIEEHLKEIVHKFRDGQYPFLQKEEKLLTIPVRHEGTRLELLP